ncbi:hypothetical protein G7067_00330 [Leucobacter insecticola]|uniref:Uncharacterized protein n=1 Tax=Leucobacter insecticola TaxID=2714934 RepID=A0A6G8FFQ5_9MICO|nr:hypothetical protein [Leucobacter insecticola]QIM15211.1 hypothetical protein G7067_00330 [Leucobacter insecticola]
MTPMSPDQLAAANTDPAQPTPKNRRARTAQLIIAGATALSLAIAGTLVVASWPQPYEAGAAASLPAGEDPPAWTHEDNEWSFDSYELIWHDMNKALQTKDRELFLSYTEGAATDQLALWWDNTSAIGWTTGYIEPYTNYDGEQIVSIGVDLGFPANQMRGSGTVDAGLILTQGFEYLIDTTGSDDDLRITSFTPDVEIMPWDDGKLFVERRDHVVVFGLEDEKALVSATADEAERAAVTMLGIATSMGGKVPQSGFTAGITGSEDRLDRWRFGNSEKPEGVLEAAGYAMSAYRPQRASEIIDPAIATGEELGGSIVILGPSSASNRPAVWLHEFAHGIHYTAAPSLGWSVSTAAYEGFARYAEYASGFTTFVPYPQVKDSVMSLGAEAYSDGRLESDADAPVAYEAAGSFYLFVAESGGDPWVLAVDSVTSGERIDEVALEMSPAYSVAAWQQWWAAK